MSPEDAFLNSAESITGPIYRTISKQGILAVYEGLDAAGKQEFEAAYAATYPAAHGGAGRDLRRGRRPATRSAASSWPASA